jgi:DNA-binding winged helix-turn-helix (wHTH) protein
MAFGEVTVDGESLAPRVFDLLLTLAERPGLTVSRGHLIETVWRRDGGSGMALDQAILDLRRALGDDARAPRFIETVPSIGYRWIFEATPPTPARKSLGATLAGVMGELRSFVDR